MKNKALILLCCTLGLVGCGKRFVPKPYGYFRLDLPDNTYQLFAEPDYPYTFLYSQSAEIRPRQEPDEQFWLDIYYPRFDARIHCSYKPVRHNLRELSLDAQDFVFKHAGKASAIPEQGYENPDEQIGRKGNDDVLVIDRNLKGIDFTLAKCCHPIYGDPVFGFVTVNGGIKIHREDCPNAHDLRSRFGYRIVKARWSGKGASQYAITLRVIGNDDIGIVSNISNIISKDEKLIMRSINIDSHDGLFSGNIVVQLDDTTKLEALIKKLRTVKGVKQVSRI